MKRPSVVPLVKKSTNVRLKTAWLRLKFRVLGRLAPRLADRQAAALFLTPRARRMRPEPGAPGLDAKRWAVEMRAARLAVWSWGEGPTVLLVHGWNGNAAQLASFVRPLVEAGFRVVAFDHPAHGSSTGRRTTVLGMTHAIQAVAGAVGPLHAVVGHSLGAAATALALFDHLPAERAVLVASPSNPPYFARRLAGFLQLTPERTEGMLEALELDAGVDLGSLDIRRFGTWLRQPALILHDVADREVPFEDGRAIAEAWPGSRLIPLTRLGHMRPLADGEVIATTVAFLREGLQASSARPDVATSA